MDEFFILISLIISARIRHVAVNLYCRKVCGMKWLLIYNEPHPQISNEEGFDQTLAELISIWIYSVPHGLINEINIYIYILHRHEKWLVPIVLLHEHIFANYNMTLKYRYESFTEVLFVFKNKFTQQCT